MVTISLNFASNLQNFLLHHAIFHTYEDVNYSVCSNGHNIIKHLTSAGLSIPVFPVHTVTCILVLVI